MTPDQALDELRQIAAAADLGLSDRLHAIIDALQPVASASCHPVHLDPLDVANLPEFDEPAEEKEIMSAAEAREFLGYAHPSALYKAMNRADRPLPSYEEGNGNGGRGNKRTFRRREILAWLGLDNNPSQE